MENEIKKQIKKFAESDLRSSREKGSIGIYETKKGLVTLNYNDGKYTFLNNGQQIFEGVKKDSVEFLISEIYDIQFD